MSKLPQYEPLLQESGRRARAVFGLMVFAAFVIRLLYLWGQAKHNPMFAQPMTDSLQHHTWAQAIASGRGMGDAVYYRAPLYYYLLGLLYSLVGPSVVAGKIMGCAIGTVSCYLIGKLASSLAGIRAGIIACLMAALYWPFIYFDNELLTVGLEICLNTLTLLLLVHAGRRREIRWFLGAGLALGLAAITRPNILAFIPFIGLWCLMIAPSRDTRWRFAAARFAVVCLGTAACVLPITIRNYVASGEFVLIASTSGVNFYIGNNAEADGASAKLPGVEGRWGGDPESPKKLAERELGRPLSDTEVSSFYFAKGLDWIKKNPASWGKLQLRKLLCFWTPYELPNNQSIRFFSNLSPVSVVFLLGFPIVAAFAGGGLFAIRRRYRNWYLLLAFGTVHMLTVLMFFCPARYRLPIAPVLIVLAAAGLSFFIRSIRRRSPQWKPYVMVCGGGGLIMLANTVGGEAVRRGDTADGHYRLGAFYAGNPEDPAHTSFDLDKAIAEFRSAIDLDHPGPSARLSLANALFRADRIAEAELEYRRAVRDYPDDVAAQRKFGEFLATQQRDAEAVRCFMLAVKNDSRSAESHQELGCLYLRMRRLRDAMEHLREALRIDPRLTRAAIFLSQAYAMQRDYDAAISVLRDTMRVLPNNVGLMLALGNMQVNAGDAEEAIKAYEEASRLQPNVPGISFGHAMALRLSGRRADAADILKSQLKATPDDVECLASLAWIRATAREDCLRNGREAASLADRALRLAMPPTPEALDAQAAAYAELGRFEEAIRIAGAAKQAAEQANRPALSRKIGKRMEMYKNRKPYRE